MTQYQLNHITDLHALSDEDVAQMAHELPGIVATLRLAARAAKEGGALLKDLLPIITFDSDLKDEVVITQDGKEKIRVSSQQMTEAEVRDSHAALVARNAIQGVMAGFKPRKIF